MGAALGYEYYQRCQNAYQERQKQKQELQHRRNQLKDQIESERIRLKAGLGTSLSPFVDSVRILYTEGSLFETKDEKDARLVILLGKTGVGKSTLCNRLNGFEGDVDEEKNDGLCLHNFLSNSN